MFMQHRKRVFTAAILFLGIVFFINENSANGIISNDEGREPFLKQVVLSDFENCQDWRAIATCPLGDTKIRKIPGKPKDLNKSVSGTNVSIQQDPKNEPEFCLGVKTFFKYPGYDRVEVKPPQAIKIPGKCRYVSGWVLCRGFAHRLFLKIKDYRGNNYLLPARYLNTEGWQQFQVYLPGYLPQSTKHTMSPLDPYFASFVVVAGLHEVRGTFYVYFDHLIASVDQFGMEYDGAEIRDVW